MVVYIVYNRLERTPRFDGIFSTLDLAITYINNQILEVYRDACAEDDSMPLDVFSKQHLKGMAYHIEVILDIDLSKIVYVNIDANNYLRDIDNMLTNDAEQCKLWNDLFSKPDKDRNDSSKTLAEKWVEYCKPRSYQCILLDK